MSDPGLSLRETLESWAASNNVDHGQLTRLFAGAEERPSSSAAQAQEGTYIVPDLPSAAWPSIERFEWVSDLNATYESVRHEFLAEYQSMRHYSEDETLAPIDSWRVFHLFLFGRQVKKNVQACPATIGALSLIPDESFAGTGCFSVLAPGTHVKPHTGFTNVRWRLHLPLVVPPGCGMRVGAETREWEEGKCLLFDDSVEHEVWNRSDQYRAVMLFDIWHPGLTPIEVGALNDVLGYWARRRVEQARAR